jgi:putative GTP pyrophosphokinase
MQESINKYILLRTRYKQLAQKISSIVQEVMEIEKLNFHNVTYRAKEIDSFSKKLEKPKYDQPFNQITDLAGIRIICYVEDDVQKVCSVIEKLFTIDKENSLDKSTELGIDKVGYKSVHYVCELPNNRTQLLEYSRFKGLKFEIQIRTILQHSWAEIEHDKNYKFSGELPKEIKRRFKLLAGSLELADREFNRLSVEIDKYSKTVKERTERGELNIPINSTSLKQYLATKYNKEIKLGLIEPHFATSTKESQIIRELNNFGLKTLYELDKIIPKDYGNILKKQTNYETNFLGLLRNFLLIKDYKKYFDKSFENDWSALGEYDDKVLIHYNIYESELFGELEKSKAK